MAEGVTLEVAPQSPAIVERRLSPTARENHFQATAAWVLLGTIFLLVYWRTLVELVGDWWKNPDYSHGFLVPLAIALVIYHRRADLRSAPLRPLTVAGLGVIGLSQAQFLAGYLGAEYFLQRSAMVGLAAGVILFLAGWAYFKLLFLPLLLFQLSIPIPVIAFNRIALPLQLIASSVAESILRICGIAVYRTGNILQLSSQNLSVTEACSGIRSLVTMITLAVILTAFVRLHWIIRVLFVLSTVGIAIVANALRVSGTGLMSHFFGPGAATGFAHWFEGWFVFLVAFSLLLLELKILTRLFGREPERAAA